MLYQRVFGISFQAFPKCPASLLDISFQSHQISFHFSFHCEEHLNSCRLVIFNGLRLHLPNTLKSFKILRIFQTKYVLMPFLELWNQIIFVYLATSRTTNFRTYPQNGENQTKLRQGSSKNACWHLIIFCLSQILDFWQKVSQTTS